MKTLRTLAATLPMLATTSAALAASFSGNWPLTITHAQRANGTYCLTLVDNGSIVFPHSGQAALTGPSGFSLPFGTFQLISHTLVTTMEDQSGQGQNAGLVFAAPASASATTLGKGIYTEVYGGEEIDSGIATFSPKGGC